MAAEAATAERVLERLARDGSVLITGAATPGLCRAVAAQLAASAPLADASLAVASPAAHGLV
jgi:hypothetical protein